MKIVSLAAVAKGTKKKHYTEIMSHSGTETYL